MAIQWNTRTRVTFADKDSDLRISISKKGTEDPQLSFYIAKSFKENLTDTEFITYGYDPDTNRIYLDRATKATGYKLQDNSNMTYRAAFPFAREDHDKLSRFVGDYKLVFDHKLKLYYADIKKKLI